MAGKAGRRVGVRVAQPALAIHGQRAQMFKGHLQALLGGVRGPHGRGTEGEGGRFVLLLAAAGRGAGGAPGQLGAAFLTKLSLEYGHGHPPLGAFTPISQSAVKSAPCSPSWRSWCG